MNQLTVVAPSGLGTARANQAADRVCLRAAKAAAPVRVLLDENLDHASRKLLGQHDVVTVTYMGWAGLKNGELLQAAESNGFDVFLTGDQTLAHEQNLSGRRRDRFLSDGYGARHIRRVISYERRRSGRSRWWIGCAFSTHRA